MSGNSTKKDNTERGAKPMSDDEIRESVMGQNTPYLDRIRRASRDSYEGGDGGKQDRD